jgi:hypothetical protein
MEGASKMRRYLWLIPPVTIGLLLLATFRLYGYAYFSLDDFNNLHWVRLRTVPESIGLLFSPSAEHFRPTGMLVYKIAYSLFDRDPRPYHWLMWGIHTFNVWLVYTVVKRLTGSRASAAVGALLFVYPPAFTDVFSNFGTIFELTGAAFFFAGILVWERKNRTPAVVLLAMAMFVLALKSKEMAITLPAVWLLQDLLLRRPWKWKECAMVLLPGIMGAWFGIQRLVAMKEPNPNQPYYMDLQGVTMGRGFSFYFNALLGTQFRWQVWCIGFVAVLLLFALLRWRLVLFFQAYVFVTFLPVIFLINHRDEFYWYFPMLGVCGLAAMLTRAVANWFAAKIPDRRLAVYASIAFVALSWWLYDRSRDATEGRRLWQQGISKDFRGFVESVHALPSPGPGETLYFNSMPQYFDPTALLFASELALHRTDLDAQFVDTFPSGARYRLEFKDSKLVPVP